MSSKNKCSKTRDINNPYEIWKCKMDFGYGDIVEIEYKVLKKYKSPKGEAEDPFARWYTAARSEATYGNWEYGDTYVRDIVSTGRRIS